MTPVAEEEGIRLGIHPEDPPVEDRGGVPGLLRSFDAFKRLMRFADSDYNAIEFCQGTFSEMPCASSARWQPPSATGERSCR